MKIKQVPQHADAIYEGEKKLIYALDENNKFSAVSTLGWEAEIESLKAAINAINQCSDDALSRAISGKTSALEYHMYHQRLDVAMLAQAMGKFQWQIKRHFNPKIFSNLSDNVLEKYAEVLGIEVAELIEIP